jgi:protein-S-isoprenylcysteine O-methyltransferase Ste14
LQAVFDSIYFAGMILQAIIRAPYARQHRRAEHTEQRVDASEGLVLGWLTVGGLVLPMAYATTPWLDFADYRLPPSWTHALGWGGVVLLLGALWIFWRSHRDLGAFWSPSLELTSDQPLITGGIYAAVRHPMYASQLVWGIAQALLFPNLLAGLGGLLAFLLFYVLRVPKEEQMMRERFGEAYIEYCQRTGEILPRLGESHRPDSL